MFVRARIYCIAVMTVGMLGAQVLLGLSAGVEYDSVPTGRLPEEENR